MLKHSVLWSAVVIELLRQYSRIRRTVDTFSRHIWHKFFIAALPPSPASHLKAVQCLSLNRKGGRNLICHGSCTKL